MRLQLALNVADIDQAVEFYSKLFDTPPAKRKPGYANFAITNPPLKLVLFEVEGAPERLNHLGVEVFDGEAVTAATERLKAAGLETLVEDETTCCYAKQDKVWAIEPQGLRWEWYRVVADSETFRGEAPEAGVDVRTEAAASGVDGTKRTEEPEGKGGCCDAPAADRDPGCAAAGRPAAIGLG